MRACLEHGVSLLRQRLDYAVAADAVVPASPRRTLRAVHAPIRHPAQPDPLVELALSLDYTKIPSSTSNILCSSLDSFRFFQYPPSLS